MVVVVLFDGPDKGQDYILEVIQGIKKLNLDTIIMSSDAV